MSTEVNKAVVRRYLEEFVSAGDTSIADELFAPDYINHTAGSGINSGREGMARSIAALKTAFPDWQVAIESMVAEGDQVVDRFRISATHTGSVNGIPPSGDRIDALGIHMWRLADGKLAEGWYLTDDLPAVAAALVPVPVPA
jgi:C-1 hydroxylase